jgi:hypothetical protein
MASWGANHGAVCYGIYAEACMPRPRRPGPDHPDQHLHFEKRHFTKRRFKKRRIPVCMHNVSADSVYHPSQGKLAKLNG